METVDIAGIVNNDIPTLAEVIRLLFTDNTSFDDDDDDDDDEKEAHGSELGFVGSSGFGRKVSPTCL
eukprot:13171187-Ditylum_brightwellii.AAC.1